MMNGIHNEIVSGPTLMELWRRAADFLLSHGERCMVCGSSEFIVVRRPVIPDEALADEIAMLWEVADGGDERWALQLDVYCVNRKAHRNEVGWTRFAVFGRDWNLKCIL